MAYPSGPPAPEQPDEQIEYDAHPHWRALIVPAGLTPVTIGLGAFLAALVPAGSAQRPLRIAVAVLALLALSWLSLWPYLRWRSTHYVISTQRVLLETGVLTRRGRDVPINRINDVSYTRTALDRLWGTGTLVIESGGERGQLLLSDVPSVTRAARILSRLMARSDPYRQH